MLMFAIRGSRSAIRDDKCAATMSGTIIQDAARAHHFGYVELMQPSESISKSSESSSDARLRGHFRPHDGGHVCCTQTLHNTTVPDGIDVRTSAQHTLTHAMSACALVRVLVCVCLFCGRVVKHRTNGRLCDYL